MPPKHTQSQQLLEMVPVVALAFIALPYNVHFDVPV
jgi:hypothetical protein